MGKGKVPEPTTPKQVNVAAGTGIAATLAAFTTWLGDHPGALALGVFTIIIGVIAVHGLITARHQARSVTPMPGTPIIPEKGDLTITEHA